MFYMSKSMTMSKFMTHLHVWQIAQGVKRAVTTIIAKFIFCLYLGKKKGVKRAVRAIIAQSIYICRV